VFRKKWVIALIVILIGAAVVGANFYFTREEGVTVAVETVRTRDLEAIVTASGTIQAKRFVNMSAVQMGRVTKLAVEEGDRVKAGQFLLQIDPMSLRGTVERGEAAVAGARQALSAARVAVETADANLKLARDTAQRQRELWSQGLTTKEQLDQAESAQSVRETELRSRKAEVARAEQMIRQEAAQLDTSRYNLSQVTLSAPFDGIVTRRNIEEGENVVVGTMNNAGTQLLTVADMSIIEAEVEVDETEIPSVRIGQPAEISIDALPDQTFTGRVTEIGNSPIQLAGQTQAGQQATNFKVTVTIDGTIEEARPGFTCSARITTATRDEAVAVPIQAMAVRDVIYDDQGAIVREPREEGRRSRRSVEPTAAAAELPAGQTRKETEGVFVLRDGRAVFVPVKVGIAGDRFFEVLSGLEPDDQVITGPFNNVRNLRDGDEVKVEEEQSRNRTTS
jgi:HlyD family secretion protein